MKQDKFLTKEKISFIKCVAIIFMFFHHLLSLENYWAINNTPYLFQVAGYAPEYLIGKFGKICVAMFAFCTGYCMYYAREKYKKYSYCISKIVKLLVSYWVVEVLLLLIGFILNEPMPSIDKLLLNLIGMYCGVGEGFEYVNSCFAWYVGFYIRFMILCPLILRYINSKKFIISFIKLVVFMIFFVVIGGLFKNITMVFNIIISFSVYGTVMLIGYIICQYSIYDNILSLMNKIRFRKFIDIIVLTGIFIVRSKYSNYIYDMIYIAPFIFVLVDLFTPVLSMKNVMVVIDFISKNSMNLWLLHSIFFMPNRKLQFIAYLPHEGTMVVIWSMILLLILSVLITYP